MKCLFITPCPSSGYGVHYWILKAAHSCRRAGLCPEQAIPEIISRMTRCPRPGEVEEAVAKAYSTTVEERGYHRVRTTKGTSSKAIKAEYDPAKLKRLADQLPLFDVNDLMEGSPINPLEVTAADFLYCLYMPEELVLIFDTYASQGQFVWRRPPDGRPYDEEALQEFKKPYPGKGAWFLCNPIHGDCEEVPRLVKPSNPTGRSRRAEECITAFRYLLMESDKAPMDLWIRAIVQLPIPIVSIVKSGGKSIHALARVNAGNVDEWDEIKERIAPGLIGLGTDEQALSSVRLTRLPGSYRADKEAWQELLFLHPHADGTPICKLLSY